MTNKTLELYFHIPFCVRKCLYCDFLSAPADEATKSRYMEALVRETQEKAKVCTDYTVTSVFFGGGTPSVVNPQALAKVLNTAKACFRFTKDAEITMEMNPGTVNADSLSVYKEAGINRISIGLQSTNDRYLEKLGRIHNFETFLKTYEAVRKAGFTNVNIDLMGALPGQSLAEYEADVKTVLELNPEHLSVYSLMIEEGTPFGDRLEQNKLEPPEEELEREMYWRAHELLTKAGYEHYEISNYAKPGFACRHNVGYWKRISYLGLGLGASSLMENRRYQNEKSLSTYLQNPLATSEEAETLSGQEQMEETMFLGLRMLEGVSRKEFAETYAIDMDTVYKNVLDRNERDGLLENVEDRVRLTPRGMDISNYVMAQFLKD